MPSEMLVLGDVIRIEEREFVYLASAGGLFYAALILNYEETNLIKRGDDKVSARSDSAAVQRRNNPIYCFVVLNTRQFDGRAASLARTDDHSVVDLAASLDRIARINAEDIASIRGKILDEEWRESIPSALREQIRLISSS